MVKISRVNMIIRAGKYMNDNQLELLKVIRSISRELSQYQIEYWHLYSYVGMWEYPYHVIRFLPSLYLDAALVPVCFMLLYQWTLNHNKNIYLYSILLSSVFAFVLKPIMVKFHFIHMFNGINYFHLILFYMA